MDYDLRESCLWEALRDDVYILEMLWNLAHLTDRPARELADDLNKVFFELRRELPLQMRVSDNPYDGGFDSEWKTFKIDEILNEKGELAGPPYYWFTLYETGVTAKQLNEFLEDKFSG